MDKDENAQDIEQLIEAQARGEETPAGVPTEEQREQEAAELDTRTSKISDGTSNILGGP